MSSGRPAVAALIALALVAGCAPHRENGAGAHAAKNAGSESTGSAQNVGSPQRSTTLQGRRIAYVDHGSGKDAVLFVHGWAGTHRIWKKQLPPFAESHRVLALDLPGHGSSEEPADGYTMDLFADAVAAVLDDAGIDKAVLVGHSNGVPVIRQFYRRYPERTRGLIAVDGAFRAMFPPEIQKRFLGRFRSEYWEDNVQAFIDGFPRFSLSEEDFQEIRADAVAQPQHAILGNLEATMEQEIWKQDPIDCPLLVVNAVQPAWTAEYEQFVRSLAPQVDYRMVSGASHFLMRDRADELNGLIREFLASRKP